MDEVRERDRFHYWLHRPENLGVLFIAGLIMVLHLLALFQVKDLIYDEVGTAMEVNWILNSGEMDPFYYESAKLRGLADQPWGDSGYFHHLPLGKLIASSSVWAFGDNNAGWRISPVLFGVTSIILFYLLCQKISSRRWFPLIATSVFAFDNFTFVMAGIAKYDVLGLTFMLASFLFYSHSRYATSGISLALAALVKPTFGFAGVVILLHWLLVRKKFKKDTLRFMGTALLSFIVLLPLLDYIATGELIYPWDRLWNYVNIHDDPSLAQGTSQYRALYGAILPWEWLISPHSVRIWADPCYEMNCNWTLWALIIPVMGYALFEVIRTRGSTICLLALLWFVLGYLPWFVIYWVFERVSYPFYFYPIIPAVCLATAYAISGILSLARLQSRTGVRLIIIIPAIGWLTAHFVMFWIMAPIV